LRQFRVSLGVVPRPPLDSSLILRIAVFCHTTIKVFINRFVPLLGLSFFLAAHLPAQTLTMVSGNGQIVFNSLFTNNVPMVVQANDARGNPVSGATITWSVQGTGTLVNVQSSTGSNGQASAAFVNSALTPYASFLDSTVTASSNYGSVSFFVTTVPLTDTRGNPAPQPTVNMEHPVIGSTVTAPAGSTLPGAVVVQVLAGAGTQANAPLPNVAVRIVNSQDSTAPAPAYCNGPEGVVLTGSNGIATCDLVITGQAGDLASLAAVVGEFHETAAFNLQIQPGVTCSYSLSSTSQPFGSAGGTGSVNVTTASTCGWTATSNASWITITAGSSGTGNGKVSYSVAANTGKPRIATISISGQTFTVNQGSGAPGSLAITTSSNLPGGTVGVAYSTTLSASGGQPPYTWSISNGALPSGLTLNPSSGIISGTPTTASTSPDTFQATVTDSAGSTLPQNFSLTINGAGSSTFKFTTTSFPNGVVNEAYQQAVTTSGGAVTPFFPSPSVQVSGGSLPAGLSLTKGSSGTYSVTGTPTTPGVSNFSLTATDAAGNTASANFTLTITGTPTTQVMTATPSTVSFAIQLGSTNIPADQQVAIASNMGVLSYTSVISTSDGASWLVAKNSTSGNTPGSITLGVTNYSALAAGQYTGTLTISSEASNSPVVVGVTLTVAAAPAITATPALISVTQGLSSGSNVTNQTIQLANGTDTVSFTASASADKSGTWLTVTPASGTTPASITAAINSGGLALGTYTGSILVTPATGAPLKIPVTLNVVNPATLAAAPAPLTFSVTQGGAAPDFQAVTVTSSGEPLTVSTNIATQTGGNWLFVTPSGGQTSLNMSVSVNPAGLSAGSYSGTITMSATDPSVAPLQLPVVLNVTPAVPTVTSVTNAASFAPGPVAPGEIVTIFGSAIGPSPGVAFQPVSGGMPVVLSNTEVFFDGHAASMVYTSAGQISAIVPYAIAGQTATNLVVEYNNVKSAGFALRVIDSVPGIFTIGASGQGAIINQDGTVNSTSNPAPAGSVVSIYATGEGQTNPPGKDGAINGDVLAELPAPMQTVTVQIGGQPAETPAYAGAAPGEPAGLLQVNATVPTGLPSGTSVPVVITVGTASSQAGVTLAVK